jgi:hypothetical protein
MSLTLTKQNALNLHRDADKSTRQKIELLWPQIFSKNIMDRVTTLEEACIENGEDINHLFDGCPDDYKKAEKAIETFAKVMREGKHESECFHYPYFSRSSGGGFSFVDCGNGVVSSIVGARLSSNSREDCKFIAEEYTDLWQIFILYIK